MKEDLKKIIAEIKANPALSLLIFLIFILITSFALAHTYRGSSLDAQKAGEFGDFVGGYFGPILSLLGIFFVVLTLREQRETTIAERKSDDIEAFEGRFFELLRTHRENVAEMTVGQGDGAHHSRRVFRPMITELQRALAAVARVSETQRLRLPLLDQLQLAYYCVFFGVGKNSSIFLSEAARAGHCEISSENMLLIEQELNRNRMHGDAYYFFDGHQQRLGHYYRHLYQMISFVHTQKLDIRKYEYVKIIRAQLSTYEQVLLLINSFSSLGWEWWSEGLMISYGMVKNIPKGLIEAYFEINVSNLFPKGYFEWEQAGGRPATLDQIERSNHPPTANL